MGANGGVHALRQGGAVRIIGIGDNARVVRAGAVQAMIVAAVVSDDGARSMARAKT